MEQNERKKWLVAIIGHSFMLGVYTALLLALVGWLIYEAVTGKWGPVKKALDSGAHRVPIEAADDGEETTGSSEVQPDEQSDRWERQRG